MAWTHNSDSTFSETTGIGASGSDKSFVVTTDAANTNYKGGFVVKRIRMEYTAGSTPAAREPTISVTDAASDIIYLMHFDAGMDMIADDAEVTEFDSTATAFIASVDSGPHIAPLPHLRVEPGQTLRIFDRVGTGVAEDIMLLHMTVAHN